MMSSKLVRANIRVNAGTPRFEVRNGREVFVVPSATMPDNIVMDGRSNEYRGPVMYPAEEIAKSYTTLERSPAPYGHPMMNGVYVSAHDPEAMNIYGIGAFNVNVRRENGRVLLDKIIDVEVAKTSDRGRELLRAISEGKPIHTSTGVLMNLEKAPEGSNYNFIARDIHFDHDAILMHQKGAATPEQGVGMMVNNEKIEVINSELGDEADWAVQAVVRELQEKTPEWKTLVDRVRSAIAEVVPSAITNALRGSNDKEEADMDEKKFDELSQKVDGLETKLDGIGDAVANAVTAAVKPIQDNLDAVKANQDAKDKAELDGLVTKIVKANVMDEANAKELTLNAARDLAKKAEPGTSAGVNANGFMGSNGKPSFVLPKGDD